MDEDRIHEQIADEAVQDQEPGRRTRWWAIIGAVIVIGAIIIAFAANGTLLSFLGGRALSSTVQQDTLITQDNIQVVFQNTSYERLKTYFIEHQTAEFKACLTGVVDNQTYYVEDYYIPLIIAQTPDSVTSAGCDQATIISLHSHPSEQCIFSDQDIISAKAFKERNPDGISALMCSTDRFTFYGE